MTLILTLTMDCHSREKFNSENWKLKGVDWQMTDFREKMISDLIKSDTLIGINTTNIIGLLGEPDKESDEQIEYLIREKYSWDIDPDYISRLLIHLDKSGISNKCEMKKTDKL